MTKNNFKARSKNKKAPKISATKLANKQNYKLGKQGKLKGKSSKKKQIKCTNTTQYKTMSTPMIKATEEDCLSDEDIKFYSSSVNKSFAHNQLIEEKSNIKGLKRKKNAETDLKFEEVPRHTFDGPANAKKMKMMLPIKSGDKIIPQLIEKDKEDADNDSGLDMESTEISEATTLTTTSVLSNEELLKRRADKLLERKTILSRLANSIISDPYEQVGKLKDVREFLHESDVDVFITVRKLAMVTLMEIFLDILPSYRIRLLSEDEQKQSMKKDTKKLVQYERSMLNNYRLYLEILEKTARGNINSKKETRDQTITMVTDTDILQKMAEIAIRCLCALLTAHPGFNYCNNIIALVVPMMIEGDQQILHTVCDAIKQVFRRDKKGNVTLEIIKTMGDALKRKNFNTDPQVLHTCLSLNIREIDMSTAAERHKEKQKKKAEADKMSRKDRKLNKRKAILEHELLETKASEDREKTLKMHTDVIKNLFVTYFRILKNAPHSVLMPAVLEGLAKFAHLINIEFFDDLFSVFNKLIQSNRLKYRELLHCVQTAFTILTGQGSVINIDPMQFYKHFYSSLFRIHAGISSPDMLIVLNCLDIMVNQRKRQVSIQRVLAFIKRVCTLCLLQLPHSAVAAMSTVRAFIRTYPRSELLFDTETQGSGSYLPELDDPEYCNAQNSALWELSLLQRHYDLDVKNVARHISLQTPTTGQGQLPPHLSSRSPVDLFSFCDKSDLIFDDRLPSTVPKKQKHKKTVRRDWTSSNFYDQCQQILRTSQQHTELEFFT